MKLHTILRGIIFTGIFAILFIPFIVSSDLFFPFITGKNFAFRVIVEIIFVAWALLALLEPEVRSRLTWIRISVGVFVAIVAVADVFGVNFHKSFWSNFERMEGLVTLLHLLGYFVVVSSMLRSQKIWDRFWQTSVGVSAILGMYGIAQLAGKIVINQGGSRLDGTFGNATYLAIYMLFHIFITTILFTRTRVVWVRAVYVGAILLQLYALYHTATRGALLGVVGGAILTAILVLFSKDVSSRVKKSAIGVLATVLIVVGGFAALQNTNFVQDSPVLVRFTNLTTSDGTVKARFLIWNMAWQGVKERPLLGWGQENFNLVFNKYYDPQMYAQEPWFDRVHNIVFDWLIAAGFLGLFGYLSMFVAALYLIYKSSIFTHIEKSLLVGLLAAYGFHNLFVFDNIMSYILFFSILAWIHASTVSEEEQEMGSSYLQYASAKYAAVIGAVVIAIALIYGINAAGYRQGKTLITALQSVTVPATIADGQGMFEKAIAYNGFGTQEVREHFVQTANRFAALQGMDPAVRDAFATSAMEQMELQIAEHPEDARFPIFAGTLLSTYGRHADALPFLERAVELVPTKQSFLFQIGANAVARGDTAKGFEYYKQAYELAPENPTAHIFYAAAAIYDRQYALADTLINDIYQGGVVIDDRILTAYVVVKRFQEALAIVDGRIAADSNNAQLYVSRAAVQLEMGNRSGAVASLQKAIETNPDFKAQGEYYISEIQAGRNP